MKGTNDGSSQAQPMQIKPLTQEDIDFIENLLPQANVYNGKSENHLYCSRRLQLFTDKDCGRRPN